MSSAYDELVKMPPEIAALIPSLTVTITKFVAWDDLPDLLHSSATLTDAEACITTDEVAWSIPAIINSPVPPRDWHGRLEIALRRRTRSKPVPTCLQHPTAPELRLPLWGAALWSELIHATEQQSRWHRAVNMLREWRLEGVEDVDEAKALLDRIPWGMLVEGMNGTSPIGLLAEMLRPTSWLNERHMNVFSIYLAFRARDVQDLWIGGVYLAQYLMTNAPATDSQKGTTKGATKGSKKKGAKKADTDVMLESKGLAEFQQTITQKPYKRLVIPANINNNHWIVFYADLKTGRIQYGMSQSPSYIFILYISLFVKRFR